MLEKPSAGSRDNPDKKDVAELLLEQVQALLDGTGTITLKREKPWASITFSGTRHYCEISATDGGVGEALAAILKAIPEQEFDLPSHFVADLLVRDYRIGDPSVALEILTIIDPVLPESAVEARDR